MKGLLIISGIILCLAPLSAQNKIEMLTWSVVDTTESETQQVKAVYDWITTHISYDVRQLKRGFREGSPEQTLRRKKAVCYGYSLLFHEMCEVINIESYVVYGYSKGFGYVRGAEFDKSNHAWNVVRADSNYLIVDATWGSGGLGYQYRLPAKLIGNITGKPGIPQKLVFTKFPDSTYFDANPEAISRTHFPIDSKWQLREYPVSYREFITDSVHPTRYLNFQQELAKVRLLSTDAQLFIDAVNSVKYNPDNPFDLAYQYYFQGSQLQLSRKTAYDSTLLPQLDYAGSCFDSALTYLGEYRTIRRGFYQTRRTNQKQAYRNGRNAIKRVSKFPTMFNGKYMRAYNRLRREEQDLAATEAGINAAELELYAREPFIYDTVSTIDTMRLELVEQSLAADSARVAKYKNQMISLLEEIKYLTHLDSAQHDSLIYYTQLAAEHISLIRLKLVEMDEYAALANCDRAQDAYLMYTKIAEKRDQQELTAKNQQMKFESYFRSAERSLNSMMDNYAKLAALTGENERYWEEFIDIRNQLYSLNALYVNALSQYNTQLDSRIRLLNRQDDILSTFGNKGFNHTLSQLTQFYNFIAESNSKSYSSDMDLYSKIRRESKERKKVLRTAAREIEREMRK